MGGKTGATVSWRRISAKHRGRAAVLLQCFVNMHQRGCGSGLLSIFAIRTNPMRFATWQDARICFRVGSWTPLSIGMWMASKTLPLSLRVRNREAGRQRFARG